MKLPYDAELLRVFIGESDLHGARPLYEIIVEEARKRGMAGATVLRGIMSFGANSRLHTAKILRLSEDLPLVIEIVDTPERIAAYTAAGASGMCSGSKHSPRVRIAQSMRAFLLASATAAFCQQRRSRTPGNQRESRSDRRVAQE